MLKRFLSFSRIIKMVRLSCDPPPHVFLGPRFVNLPLRPNGTPSISKYLFSAPGKEIFCRTGVVCCVFTFALGTMMLSEDNQRQSRSELQLLISQMNRSRKSIAIKRTPKFRFIAAVRAVINNLKWLTGKRRNRDNITVNISGGILPGNVSQMLQHACFRLFSDSIWRIRGLGDFRTSDLQRRRRLPREGFRRRVRSWRSASRDCWGPWSARDPPKIGTTSTG